MEEEKERTVGVKEEQERQEEEGEEGEGEVSAFLLASHLF